MLMGYEWNMYQNLNTWNVLNESHTDEVECRRKEGCKRY